MAAVTPPFDISADPLIAEAKQRARRRRLLALAAAGLIAAGILAFELVPSGSGGGVHGTIPWLPTKPSIGPAHPPLAAPCTATQLHGSLHPIPSNLNGVWRDTAGDIELVNRSSTACALVGSPSFALEGWRTTRYREGPYGGSFIPYDPLAPSVGSLRALRRGAHVTALMKIPGCTYHSMGGQAAPTGPLRPRSLALTAPGGGKIMFDRHASTNASCNAPAGSSVQVTRYVPYVPTEKPSSHLPLSARIVRTSSDRHSYYGYPRTPNVATAARAGGWLSYTVVLKNRGSSVFRFGATCPSYTESVAPNNDVAYVLNCRPVGSIDPGKSVRFAMRVRLPREPRDYNALLDWTLSPHTYNPPYAEAGVVRH